MDVFGVSLAGQAPVACSQGSGRARGAHAIKDKAARVFFFGTQFFRGSFSQRIPRGGLGRRLAKIVEAAREAGRRGILR